MLPVLADRRRLEVLLEQESWEAARQAIDRELKRHPGDHWLLTQRGVTFYEEGRYEDALPPLLESLKIVPDCPLTLWNVAGVLDALGKPDKAVRIYTWLLKSKTSPDDDPCWESREWADSLKTDCVYRVGVCFRRMGLGESAENCFRQYINLILAGMTGTYTIDDAAKCIRELHAGGHQKKVEREVRDAINSTLQEPGVLSVQGNRRKLPKLELADLLGP